MLHNIGVADYLTSERVVNYGALDKAELRAFAFLIDHRRPLPVYLGDRWRCYTCLAEFVDFFAMVDHIMEAHSPEPYNEEDEMQGAGLGAIARG